MEARKPGSSPVKCGSMAADWGYAVPTILAAIPPSLLTDEVAPIAETAEWLPSSEVGKNPVLMAIPRTWMAI